MPRAHSDWLTDPTPPGRGQAAATADLTGRLLPVPGWLTDPVCFFLICHRHWFNRVPGANLRIACLPSALTLTLPVPTDP